MVDRELDRMLATLKAMPHGHREQVLERLSPQERVQLEARLAPERDPEECFSLAVAELLEKLRDGPVSTITDNARAAFLNGSAELGNSGTAKRLDVLATRPSLMGRLGGWLAKGAA